MRYLRMRYMAVVLLSVLSIECHAQQYSVLDYGASNDTTKLSTTAINKAISACSKNGGGEVVFPAGHYKSGTIVLKSHVHLLLSAGAILYASTNPCDFPRQSRPVYRSQKDKAGWYALIYAEGATDIGIFGKGVINGQGAMQQPRPGKAFKGDMDGRPRNILFISCKKVDIEDITLLNAGIWNQHYLDCEDVLVAGIRVFNHSNRNNDGIDIDGCRRFTLSNSIIDADDDGICLKSTGLAPCENVVVTGCIVSSFTNAIKCGTESTGGFKNIVISDCIVKPSKSSHQPVFKTPKGGITAISLEIVDGGIMDGVNVDNIVIEGTECPLYLRLGNRARKHVESAAKPPLGVMRNIHISNINAYNCGNYSSSITGIAGDDIDNVYLSNIQIRSRGGVKKGEYILRPELVKEDELGYPQPTVWGNLPSYGLFLRHIGHISLHNVSLDSDEKEQRVPLTASYIGKLVIRDMEFGKNNAVIWMKSVKESDMDKTVHMGE